MLTIPRKGRRTGASPSEVEIESVLNLSFPDVRVLWTPVYIAVDPAYWDPLQWRPDSVIDSSVFTRMKSTSYRLISLLIKSYSPGTKFTKNISTDTRLLALFNSSDPNKMTPWPRLPELPSNADTWEAMCSGFVCHTENIGFTAFEAKMHAIGRVSIPTTEPSAATTQSPASPSGSVLVIPDDSQHGEGAEVSDTVYSNTIQVREGVPPVEVSSTHTSTILGSIASEVTTKVDTSNNLPPSSSTPQGSIASCTSLPPTDEEPASSHVIKVYLPDLDMKMVWISEINFV